MSRPALVLVQSGADALSGPERVDRAPARYAGIDFKPPAAVASAAARGLRLRAEHGRGGTAVGVARARDLSNRKRVSPETIRRMVSYFARHAVDSEAPGWADNSDPSAGWVAWLLWGGNPGRAWANRIRRQMDRADEESKDVTDLAVVERCALDWLTRTPAQSSLSTMPDSAARGRMWLDYVRRAHGPAENALRQRWTGYLRARAKRTADRIADTLPKSASMPGVRRVISDSDMAVILDIAGEQDLAAGYIGVQRVRSIIRMGWAESVRAGLDGLTWNPVLDPSDAALAEMVQRVDAFTKLRTAEVVRGGLLNGDSVNQIQARLMRDVAYSPVRALRIARTEATKFATKGSRLAYDDAANMGVRFKVGWLSARDASVRDSHTALDGQEVNVGEPFTLPNGEKGSGPGEFQSASESVNCRCTTIPVID